MISIKWPSPPQPHTHAGCELSDDYTAPEDSWTREQLDAHGDACAKAALEAAAEATAVYFDYYNDSGAERIKRLIAEEEL